MARKRGGPRKSISLTIVALALLAWAVREFAPDWFRPAPQPEGDWRTVVRVVDGDTLLLDGNERVRLIGVDTPETVDRRRPVEYYGKEASAFLRRMAEGKRVRLAYDQQRKDGYGRTLAYVHLADGTLLNGEIIRQGYGHAYTRYPFRYADEFRAYEREAREQRRGLWAE